MIDFPKRRKHSVKQSQRFAFLVMYYLLLVHGFNFFMLQQEHGHCYQRRSTKFSHRDLIDILCKSKFMIHLQFLLLKRK